MLKFSSIDKERSVRRPSSCSAIWTLQFSASVCLFQSRHLRRSLPTRLKHKEHVHCHPRFTCSTVNSILYIQRNFSRLTNFRFEKTITATCSVRTNSLHGMASWSCVVINVRTVLSKYLPMCSQSQMHSYRWITPINAPQFYILSASHSMLRQLRFAHHKMTNSRLVLTLSLLGPLAGVCDGS